MSENRAGTPDEHDKRLDHTPMWTVEELCEKLHASPETVRSWRKNGTGPRAYKIGRHVLFEEADVRAWIKAHEIRGGSASRRHGDAQHGTGW
ncbi:helix-turn-helix transcriptional regulator [Promicromonospora sp. NPDC052451]|uniref:helix-turn-helix transcriptional regulator n=1 Tax=Promicromonospora sp. NPDC052451 TaxID=3364407 RepID=UPI0037C88CE3